jgi:hypothetical protein
MEAHPVTPKEAFMTTLSLPTNASGFPSVPRALPFDIDGIDWPCRIEPGELAFIGVPRSLALVAKRLGARPLARVQWRVGFLRCSRGKLSKDHQEGWECLQLGGITGHVYSEELSAPRLHISPKGGVIFEPFPPVRRDDPFQLFPVTTADQMLDLLEEHCPYK